MRRQSSSYLWILVAVLLVVWGVLLFRMDSQWFGHHEGTLTWISSAIRNWNEHGAATFNFLPIRNSGPTTPDNPDNWYYLHHPPTIVWINALAAQFFGLKQPVPAPQETSLRMVGYITTMVTLALYFVLVRRLTRSKRVATIAVLLYAATPAVLFFGRFPLYDMLLMPLVYLFMIFLLDWMAAYTHRRSILMTFVAIAIMWIDWPGAFYLAGAGLFALIFGGTRQRIGIVAIGFGTILGTAAMVGYMALAHPETLANLLRIIGVRSTVIVDDITNVSFTTSEFIIQHINHLLTTISLAVVVLGTAGLVRLLIRPKDRAAYFILLALIAAPTVFLAAVPHSFHFHDWYKMHFLPGLALTAALLIDAGWRLEPVGLKRYVKPLIVAIIVCSVGVTIWWLSVLHSVSTSNVEDRELAATLPLYTAPDDLIGIDDSDYANKVEYYAYRNINWGISSDYLREWLPDQSDLDLYYIQCLSRDENFDERARITEIAQLSERCRLLHIVIPPENAQP